MIIEQKETHPISRSAWPSSAYSSYLASKLVKTRSRRVQSFFIEQINDTDKEIQQIIKENFVRLEISFNSLQFRKVTEEPSYTLTDLVSDFGGNISLWLGWSIFAIFELMIFVMHTLEALYVKYLSLHKGVPQTAFVR